MKKDVTYLIENIVWDGDCTAPTCMMLISPTNMSEDEISDWLSDHYGFCHKGFSYREI